MSFRLQLNCQVACRLIQNGCLGSLDLHVSCDPMREFFIVKTSRVQVFVCGVYVHE